MNVHKPWKSFRHTKGLLSSKKALHVFQLWLILNEFISFRDVWCIRGRNLCLLYQESSKQILEDTFQWIPPFRTNLDLSSAPNRCPHKFLSKVSHSNAGRSFTKERESTFHQLHIGPNVFTAEQLFQQNWLFCRDAILLYS